MVLWVPAFVGIAVGMAAKDILEKLQPEPYVMALFGMVVLASILPVRGVVAHDLSLVVKLAMSPQLEVRHSLGVSKPE